MVTHQPQTNTIANKKNPKLDQNISPAMNTAKSPVHVHNQDFLTFPMKKWTLMSMMAIDILMLIIYIIFSDVLAEKAIESRPEISPDQYAHIKAMTMAIIISSSAIGIPLQLLFLYGIYSEQICLATAYTVLSVLATIITIFQAISQPFFWGSAIWAAMITIVATLYLRELHTIRRAEIRRLDVI